MSEHVNIRNFKLGACTVSFKNQVLGATSGGVKIKVHMDTYDVKCDQTFNQPLRRIVTAVKISVSMTLLEIDPNITLALAGEGRIDSSIISSDLLNGSGLLTLTPIAVGDSVGYRFPAAVFEPAFDYSIDSAHNHQLAVNFSASPDQSGVYMEKFSL